MKRFITIFALLIVALYGNTYAQNRVRVPRGKAILIDGKFSPGEWQDSAEIAISDAARLYVKTSEQYVYLCVRLMRANNFGLDMYVSDSTKEIYNLHVSAKLGERQLKDNAYPDWQWWTNRDWTANVSRIVSFEEKKFLPDEVKELQISKQRFQGKQWLTMFEIQTSTNTQNFPTQATNKKIENWLILEFNK